MRKTLAAIGGALLGAPLVLLAPPAQADDSDFVSEAKSLGFPQASDSLISTARSACYFLSLDRDPDQVADRISRYLSVDAGLTNRFFEMSVGEYCPQYLDRVGG